MLKIPRRYNHFVFGVIQSGLTCAVATAIARLSFPIEGSAISSWLRILAVVLGDNAADRLFSGNTHSQSRQPAYVPTIFCHTRAVAN